MARIENNHRKVLLFLLDNQRNLTYQIYIVVTHPCFEGTYLGGTLETKLDHHRGIGLKNEKVLRMGKFVL